MSVPGWLKNTSNALESSIRLSYSTSSIWIVRTGKPKSRLKKIVMHETHSNLV